MNKYQGEVPFEVFDEQGFIEEISSNFDIFSEQMQLMIHEALKHAVNKRDYWHIQEWMLRPDIWKIPMVSLDTFIDSPHYLNKGGDTVFEMVREICREIIEGNYREAVEVAGIGSGKSFKSTILATYVIHMLLCLRNPFKFYQIDSDKPIAIMNMAPTSTQALAVVFTGLKSIINESPFFKQFNPVVQAAQIRFEKEKLLMVSGNSKATTPLGYNVFCAILDEAAFFLNNEETDAAEEVYQSLNRRITSRFGEGNGMMIVISSPKYVGDFITSKILEAREIDRNGNKKYKDIFSVQLPSWKAKGVKRCSMERKFFLDARKKEILEMSESQILKEGRTINYAFGPPLTDNYDVWEIPGDFATDFNQNAEKAMRDFGAQASENIEGFFPNPSKITNMFNLSRLDPVISPGSYRFSNRPLRTPYYIHLDLGFNKNGKGDHTGFSMCHFGGWVKEEGFDEYKMKVVVDVVEQIGINGDTGEVDMSEVRQRIYDLKELGFNIRLVTFDQFASKDFSQILNKRGFRTDLLSVDRDADPYNTLKELIYDGRLDIYKSEIVERELKGLELVKGSKIDHRINGSKDATDALCGAVFNVITHTPKSNISVRNVVTDDSPDARKLQAFKERTAKEKYYEKIQKQVDRQNEIQNKMELIQQNILDRKSNSMQFYEKS